MARERILVVDDEKDILDLVGYNLAREGYEVVTALTGEQALQSARLKGPDLIILDLLLPGIGGLEVARKLKGSEATAKIPLIILTAKGEEADIVTGLELGADDYVTKPFSPRVLVARVRAVIRHHAQASEPDGSPLKIEDMVIHPGHHEVTITGRRIHLTPTEFRMLHLLVRRPGWVLTRTQIVDGIHGKDYAVTERSVDVQMTGLRRKLGAWGARIETVRGVGYRFMETR